MTTPSFGIRLFVDSTDSKKGADEHVAAVGRTTEAERLRLQATKSATEQLKAAYQQQARASQELTGWFERESAAIRAKSTVQLSEVEVYRRVRAALEQRVAAGQALEAQQQRERAETQALFTSNTNYLASLDAVRAAIARKRQADEQLVASQYATAQSLQNVGKAASGSVQGLRTMSTGLASLALSEVGARTGLGSLVSTLSFFALGSLTSFGVIAGLTAIAILISKITEASRLGKKDMDDFLERGRKLADQNRTPAQERAGLVSEQQRATREIEKQETALKRVYDELVRIKALGGGQNLYTAALQGSAEQLAASLRDLRAAARGFGAEIGKIDDDAAEKAKRAREEATQAAKARLGEVQRLQDAELAAVEAIARRRGDTRALEAALIDLSLVAIERQVRGSERLTAAEKDRLRVALELQAAAEAEARARAVALAVPILPLEPTQREAFLQRYNPFGKTTVGRPQSTELFSRDDAIVLLADELDKVAEQERRIKRLLVDELAGAFRSVFSGAGDDVQRLVRDLEQAAGSIAKMISRAKELDINFKLGAGFSGKDADLLNIGAGAQLGGAIGSTLGSAAGGAAGVLGGGVGGALAGAAFGPLGAAAGAASGILSGLFSVIGGGAERARAAAEAQKAYNLNLADFVAIAHPRGALDEALSGITKQFEDLAQQAAAAHGIKAGGATPSTEEIQRILNEIGSSPLLESFRAYYTELLRLRGITEDNIEATKRRIAQERQQYLEDVAVRALRAAGRTAEADAQSLANQHERERIALERQYGETMKGIGELTKKAALAALDHAQALEKERLAAEQAFQAGQTRLGIQARIEELIGNTTEAARIRRTIAIESEINEAGKLLDQGIITEEMYARLADALRNSAEAANSATGALRENLALRQLQAAAIISGNLADQQRFEDESRRVAQRLELEQAIKDGADSATEALIAQTHAMEDQAVAADRARRALEATTRLLEDLAVRELRALGRDAAAGELANRQREQDEIRRATAGGESSATIAEILRVQALERARADDLRRIAQQEAFDRALESAATPAFESDTDTRVNLAVGISETTGSRMAGLLTAQLAYSASLPRIEVILARMDARDARIEVILLGIRDGSLDLEAVDEGLALLSAGAELANGVPTGNR